MNPDKYLKKPLPAGFEIVELDDPTLRVLARVTHAAGLRLELRAGQPPPPASKPRLSLRYVAHNLLAHPLLVLCPPLGEWLHEATA